MGEFFVNRQDNIDINIVYNNAIGNFYKDGHDTSIIDV